MNIQKRKGFILISEQLLRENNEQMFKALFGNFFPIYIESDYSHGFNDRRYYGLSPHFDELEEGEAVPEYLVTMIADKNGISLNDIERK